MAEKSLCERLMDAYTSDASKHEVRKLKKEYSEASTAERTRLRQKNPDRTDIYDYIEKTLKKKNLRSWHYQTSLAIDFIA